MRRGQAAPFVAGLALAIAAVRPGAPPATSCREPEVVGARGALLAVSCERRGTPLVGAARLAFGLPLDLNRADARALEALPGVGRGRAAAIVHARSAAPFCDVRELARVPGFGRATLERLAPSVEAGCTTPVEDARWPSM